MFANAKPSVQYPVKGQIAPQSIAAAGNATSAWIDVTTGIAFVRANINLGAPGGGTLSVDINQATDNSGTGAKAVATGALTGLNAAGVSEYEFRPDDVLDINNGFKFIQVKINNVGGTGALASATVQVGPQRYES